MTLPKKPCTHPTWTVPGPVPIKAEGSQEIIGVAQLQVCLKCGHSKGYVSNGSGFNPSGKVPLDFPGDSDIGVEARKALNGIPPTK